MPENKEKILSIQFLRGIGAIMVVLCHTSFTNWGGCGVEIFLIISGFVAMYSTQKGAENYWMKRLIKIIPLYWLMTLGTAFLVCVAPRLFNSYEVNAEYLIKSLLFIPYEHSGILQPVLGLGWTLNYEMFFYLLFWIAIKINYFKRGELVVGISVLLVILNGVFDFTLPFSFWMDDILLEFSYGIILFKIYEKYSDRLLLKSKNYATLMCWGVIVIGAICMEITFLNDSYRGITTGLIGMTVVGVVLFLGCNVVFPNVIIFVGNISYVLYLIHIYPVRLVEAIIKCPDKIKILLAIVSIMLAVCCAGIWDYFVEQRVQKYFRKRFIRK